MRRRYRGGSPQRRSCPTTKAVPLSLGGSGWLVLVAAGWMCSACTPSKEEAPLPGEERAAQPEQPGGRIVFEAEWGGQGNGPGQLEQPMGVALGPRGRLYVTDSGNARVQVYEPDGTLLSTWKLSDGVRPVGIAVRPDGATLVTDYAGDEVLVFDAEGQIASRWGRSGTGEAEFNAPTGVALTPEGNALVVEFMGQRVQELDASGRFVRFIDGGEPAASHVAQRPPIPGMDHDAMEEGHMSMGGGGAQGNPHGLYLFPSDVAVGPDGTIYVTNSHGYELLVFDGDGSLRAGWGRKGSDPGQWEIPVGVATDTAGNLYVADSANFRVQILQPDGVPLVVSRAGERWYETTRRIYSPTDVAVGADGRLYVADFAASKVQRFRVELP